jgi:hypothetical protein
MYERRAGGNLVAVDRTEQGRAGCPILFAYFAKGWVMGIVSTPQGTDEGHFRSQR